MQTDTTILIRVSILEKSITQNTNNNKIRNSFKRLYLPVLVRNPCASK